MTNVEYEYEVYDDHGQYGRYIDRMTALMAVNKLNQRGTSPKMYEVRRTEVDYSTECAALRARNVI